jgi:CheY-like chemotaxis protein
MPRVRLSATRSSGRLFGEARVEETATGGDNLLTKLVRQIEAARRYRSRIKEQQSSVMGSPDREQTPLPELAAAGLCRILVAEDQAVNWMLVERLLANLGHSAFNALDGSQVLEMLESGRYDLVLMDCQMPVLDGYATAREIRRREITEGWKHIPIVAMTANAVEGDRNLCLAAGMDDYLTKPVTTATIDGVLARWLPKKGEAAVTLDPERIRELHVAFPGNEGAELFERLQREVAWQLQRIATSLAEQNGAEAADAAHRIVSSARMIGASALGDAALALQSCARHDPDVAQNAQIEVSQQWVAACAALEAELLEPKGAA